MSSVYIQFSDCIDAGHLDVSKKVASTPKAVNKLYQIAQDMLDRRIFHVNEIPQEFQKSCIYFTTSTPETSENTDTSN